MLTCDVDGQKTKVHGGDGTAKQRRIRNLNVCIKEEEIPRRS